MLRKPMRTQNLPLTMTLPSCGQMKYTWALAGAAGDSAGSADTGTDPDATVSNAKKIIVLRMLATSFRVDACATAQS